MLISLYKYNILIIKNFSNNIHILSDLQNMSNNVPSVPSIYKSPFRRILYLQQERDSNRGW